MYILQRIKTIVFHSLYRVLARRKLKRLLLRAKRIIDCPEIKVVSFDVFDTCLTRLSYQPQDVFRLALQKTNLYQDRCRAESELKRTGSPYPTFEEIWRFLGIKCHLSEDQVQQLSQREIQWEKRFMSARKPIMDLYEYALRSGKRVIAISDMYLDKHTLGDMLSMVGFRNIDRVYVSCECQGSKSDGKLYDYVLEQEPVTSPGQVFHIGNDYVSDSWKARRKGLKHLCVPSPYHRFLYSSHKARQYMKEHMSSVQERCLFGHILNACEEDGGLSFKKTGLDLRTFSKAIVFPLLFRIDEFIFQNEEVQNNYNEIYFISRDGWLPMKGYQMMRDYYGRGLPAVYLYGSRRFYKKGEDEKKNQRIREYYQGTLKLKEGRAIIYDIGYAGSVSSISKYFDSTCIIDKIYLWQTDANKKVDKVFNSKTFVLDDSIGTNLRTFLEPVFSISKEGSIVDIEKKEDCFVPVYPSFEVRESTKRAVDEIHSIALALLASYMPYKSLVEIPDLNVTSFFSELIYHYFGGLFHSSASCLKALSYKDPLCRSRHNIFSLDKYVQKEVWNQHKGVYYLKVYTYRLYRRMFVK
jgi:predicted HAD superfamily hydrolase